jgi:hypothetical protein
MVHGRPRDLLCAFLTVAIRLGTGSSVPSLQRVQRSPWWRLGAGVRLAASLAATTQDQSWTAPDKSNSLRSGQQVRGRHAGNFWRTTKKRRPESGFRGIASTAWPSVKASASMPAARPPLSIREAPTVRFLRPSLCGSVDMAWTGSAARTATPAAQPYRPARWSAASLGPPWTQCRCSARVGSR